MLLPGSQALWLKCWALLLELFALHRYWYPSSGFKPRQEWQYQYRYR